MTVRGRDSYSIQSVDHALDVLEALCEEGDDVRISHLSEKLGMNKTSVFRLLATFENRGYVEREKGSGKYRLGLSAYEIGQKFLSRMSLLRKARPVMERLVRECNEAIYLVVRRDEEVLFLDLVDTLQQVKIVSLAGRRFPLTKVAAGQVILAQSPGLLRSSTAQEYAKATELASIRLKGYGSDCHALGEGVASLAVALNAPGGEIPGSLCLVGPEFRMSQVRIENDLQPRLREAGEIISSKLGYLGLYLGRELV